MLAEAESDTLTLRRDKDNGREWERHLRRCPVRCRSAYSELSPKYETARVFCGQAEANALPTSYTEVAIADESIRYEAQPGADVVCYWINVEVPPIEVRVNVSSCLPYYEFFVADLEYLSLNCTPEAGVDVQIVSGDAYAETVTTSVYGLAEFQTIPPGTLVMTESSPELRTVRVFCGTADLRVQQCGFPPIRSNTTPAPASL